MTALPNPDCVATRVWCIDLAVSRPALLMIEAETPRLSQADRDRAARFANGEAAQNWIAARVVLRLILERCLGIDVRRVPFAVSARGKPNVPDANLAFSLSHGAHRVLVATGPAEPLGIDIEGPRPVRLTGSRRDAIEAAGAVLSRQVLPVEPDERFLQSWVRLEALSKAEGEGMARVLSRAGAYGPGRKAGLSAELLPRNIQVADLALGEGLFAAIATGLDAMGPLVAHLPTDSDGLRAFALG